MYKWHLAMVEGNVRTAAMLITKAQISVWKHADRRAKEMNSFLIKWVYF